MALLVSKPAQVPAIWFDEGWNLSVARNLAESGFYGERALGEPVAPTLLSTGLPAIAPLAVSFRLFGVGAWQGRLPGILFTAAALLMLTVIGRLIYNRSVALASLAVALLMTGAHSHLHPVLLGRQALGEMPAVTYLLAGYLCLTGWGRRSWMVALSVLLWGLGLASKPQTLPFFILSLLAVAAWTLVHQRWKLAAWVAGALAGSMVIYKFFDWLPSLLLPGPDLAETRMGALFQGLLTGRSNTNWDMAFVTGLAPHVAAWTTAWPAVLPALAGLMYGAVRFVMDDRRGSGKDAHVDAARLALLAFAGSWFLWWAVLSVGWMRYLFPALFVSTLFTAALLHDLTGGFSPTHLRRQIRQGGRARSLALTGAAAAVVLVVVPMAKTWTVVYHAYGRDADASLFRVVDYLNKQTAENSAIESFESELFFLLKRRYHYPPNEVQFQLNRRVFLGEDVKVTYDPLAADPDYLVLGPIGRLWRLYEPAIAAGDFRLLHEEGMYEVYERASGSRAPDG